MLTQQKQVLPVAFGKDFRHQTIPEPSPALLALARPTNHPEFLSSKVFSMEQDRTRTVSCSESSPDAPTRRDPRAHSTRCCTSTTTAKALKATATYTPTRRACPPWEQALSAWIKVHSTSRSCFVLLQRLEARHRMKSFSKDAFCPPSDKMFLVLMEYNFVH